VSLADCGLQPFGALKGEYGKASHLRGFSLVGAPGFEPGTSSPPGLYSVLAGDGPTWREVASFLGNIVPA
jgi:hypothetical protein